MSPVFIFTSFPKCVGCPKLGPLHWFLWRGHQPLALASRVIAVNGRGLTAEHPGQFIAEGQDLFANRFSLLCLRLVLALFTFVFHVLTSVYQYDVHAGVLSKSVK